MSLRNLQLFKKAVQKVLPVERNKHFKRPNCQAIILQPTLEKLGFCPWTKKITLYQIKHLSSLSIYGRHCKVGGLSLISQK